VSGRLERSARDRVLAGVCGGIAEYYVVSPSFVRALVVIATILSGGMFFFVYLILAAIIPAPHSDTPHV
jgi:phage shock protein PspC (stress-responsive transcriptional regulator)